MSTAHSGTSLAKKLGIKAGYTLLLNKAPRNYFMLFETLPDGLKELKQKRRESADFIHVFCTEFKELKKCIPAYINALKKTGMLWISWPKGGSEIPTDLKRDLIRDHLLSIGLVDVKVAAIDDDWSGLKFVYRVSDR